LTVDKKQLAIGVFVVNWHLSTVNPDFWTANVKNKFTHQNNGFGSANKKANFEALFKR